MTRRWYICAETCPSPAGIVLRLTGINIIYEKQRIAVD